VKRHVHVKTDLTFEEKKALLIGFFEGKRKDGEKA
jgi:hypothetical protein